MLTAGNERVHTMITKLAQTLAANFKCDADGLARTISREEHAQSTHLFSLVKIQSRIHVATCW